MYEEHKKNYSQNNDRNVHEEHHKSLHLEMITSLTKSAKGPSIFILLSNVKCVFWPSANMKILKQSYRNFSDNSTEV